MAHHDHLHHDPRHDDRHGHHHGHGTTDTGIDWAEMASLLESRAELFTPLYERALGWLAKEVTEPGLIVDAGSGPGVIACLFAEVFEGARIVAADGSAPLLERAAERAARYGVGDRFGTLAGELPGVLDELEYPADLLWASRSVHHLGDQRAALAAYAARVAPGGTLAVMEGACPPGTCRATSASAGRDSRPASMPWRPTGSPACAPNCRAPSRTPRTGPPC